MKFVLALVVHEVDATEIVYLDFAIKDKDNMPIDDFAMISQWKLDSSFKVIIDLKTSRNKISTVTEVHIFNNFILNSFNRAYDSSPLEFEKFPDKAKQ